VRVGNQFISSGCYWVAAARERFSSDFLSGWKDWRATADEDGHYSLAIPL